jgi:uncharacterized membrane protein YbhN (UPF0104 family)
MSRWRALGGVVLAALVLTFVLANRTELPAMWRTLRSVDPRWCVASAVLTALWLANLILLHLATLRATRVRLKVTLVASGATIAHFLNLTTKSAGMAGLAAMRSEARRAGLPERVMTAGYVLAGIISELGFAVALTSAFVVLSADGLLTAAEVMAAAVFALYAASRIAVVVAASRRRERLRALWRLPRRPVDWALRRDGSNRDASSNAAADELFDALEPVRHRVRVLTPAALHGLAAEALAVAVLWSSAHAVGARISPLEALVSYSVAGLFGIIGFLPAGLGFVEVSLTAVLVGFGVTGTVAAAAVLVFRAFELWLPVVLGASLSHRLRGRHM